MFQLRNTRRASALAGCAAAALTALGAGAASATTLFDGNLVVSVLTYSGTASTVTVGQPLPGGGVAIADGSYPNVFANDTVDSSFGVTAAYTLQVLKTNGVSATVTNTIAAPSADFTGSFSSKSEGALNLSTNGRFITFAGYAAAPNVLDASNANTPGVIEPGNPVTTAPTYRTIAQVGSNGKFTFTNTSAYPGNNPRAAILVDGAQGSTGAPGVYLVVGNAGNGNGGAAVTAANGVQAITPGTGAYAKVGSFNAHAQDPNVPSSDKASKDDNYRGETVFNNTLYVTKGSGSNGVDTVYQVGETGTLPTSGASNPISILPGFPTDYAKTQTNPGFYPFGLFFANSTTLYVADEGDGTMADAATDPNAGLEKWSLVNGVWHEDYTLQAGLDLGQQYGVAGYPTNLDPATDGLRNITGHVNADGTVTIYAVTSTISANGDQGADPDRLVAINDVIKDLTLPNNESFSVLETAAYGQVIRGVSLAPIPEPATWAMMLMGFGGLGAVMRMGRRGGRAANA